PNGLSASVALERGRRERGERRVARRGWANLASFCIEFSRDVYGLRIHRFCSRSASFCWVSPLAGGAMVTVAARSWRGCRCDALHVHLCAPVGAICVREYRWIDFRHAAQCSHCQKSRTRQQTPCSINVGALRAGWISRLLLPSC